MSEIPPALRPHWLDALRICRHIPRTWGKRVRNLTRRSGVQLHVDLASAREARNAVQALSAYARAQYGTDRFSGYRILTESHGWFRIDVWLLESGGEA